MKKFKILLCTMVTVLIGVVFAAGWIFCSGTSVSSVDANGTIGTEWLFTTEPKPKALLQGDTVHLIYDDLVYNEGDTYNGNTIDGVDTNFNNRVASTLSTNGGFFRSNAVKVVLEESFKDYKPTSTYAWFYDCRKVTSIENLDYLDTSSVTNMMFMFYSCRVLPEIDVSSFDTSKVEKFTSMFDECILLTELDVSSFVTSSATNMMRMFNYCTALTEIIGLDTFDTSMVQNMESLFNGCNLTSLDLSAWDTSNVLTFYSMFRDCRALTEVDLSSFDTSSVGRVGYMFFGCSALETIYADPLLWNMENVTFSTSMFYGCTSLVGGCGTVFNSSKTDGSIAKVDGYEKVEGYLTHIYQPRALLVDDTIQLVAGKGNYNVGDTFGTGTISKVDTNFYRDSDTEWGFFSDDNPTKVVVNDSFGNYKGTSMEAWFFNLADITEVQGVEKIDTTLVESMYYTFNTCESLLELDLTSWDTSKVTNMANLFENCEDLTSLDVSNWDTSSVTSLYYTFCYCAALPELDVSNWDTSKVTDMQGLFESCEKLTSLNITGWNTDSAEDISWMFQDSYLINNLDLSGWNTSKVTDMQGLFYGCRALTSLNITGWDTSSVTKMAMMFQRTPFTELDLTDFDVSSVQNIDRMFESCSNLTSLNLSTWDTSSATNMYAMFNSCSALTELDLSSFDTSSVESMDYMFYGCSALTTIYANPMLWSTESLTGSQYSMFNGCTSLVGGNGTVFNPSYTGAERANVDGYAGKQGYLTDIYHPMALLTGSTVHFVYDLTDYAVGDTYNGETISAVDTDFNNRKLYFVSGSTVLGNGGFFRENNPTKVVFEESFKNYKPTKINYWFNALSALTTVENEENVDTSCVTNMTCLFRDCTSLTEVDLSDWDTSSCTNFQSVFMGCSGITKIDVSGWDLTSATKVTSFFYGCSSLVDVNVMGGNTSSLTDMGLLFRDCSSLTELDLSSWDVSSVTKMASIFDGCTSLKKLNVSNWDVSNLDNSITCAIFKNCSSLTELDLSSWNTSKLQKTKEMFYGCTNLKTIYVDHTLWNMSAVTDSTNMFTGCTSLVGGNGTAYSSSYIDVARANVDVYNGQVGYLTDITHASAILVGNTVYMVYGDDIYHVGDEFNGETITAVDVTFGNRTNGFFATNNPTKIVFDQSIQGYQPTSMNRWFSGSGLTSIENLSYLDTSNVVSMDYLFYNSKISTLDLSSLDTSSVASANRMFANSAFTSLDLSSFDTSSMTVMTSMFQGCSSLQQVNLTGWNTSEVTNMAQMFQGCSSLNTLDISSFNTAKVTNMMGMFGNCSALTTIYASDLWNTASVTSSNNMFGGCGSLIGGNGISVNNGHLDKSWARIGGRSYADGTNGYFTAKA